MDLTVAAVPGYFASMAAERRWLAHRAREQGPSAADYTKSDTIASLTMGVGSLLMPFVAERVVRQILPGKGRFPKVLVRTAVGAATVTTIADRFAPWATDGATVAPTRRRIGRLARVAARVGGPVSVLTGALAIGTTVSDRGSATRMWKRNRGRDLGEGPLGWLVAIAGWDLMYYWNHRFMHEVRGLWAIHVVHHSSERYNLSTALRQPVADMLGTFLPYGMLSRLGVRPRLVVQARAINLLYQYWIHTDTIRRLGPVEDLLNTPSHHRVHHGANSRYIDRNHGSILIVWDRLFRTFAREDEPVVYGLTKNIHSYQPTRIASHELVDIVRDVASSDNWSDRLSFVLRGPGWAYRRHADQPSGSRHEVGRVPEVLADAGVA